MSDTHILIISLSFLGLEFVILSAGNQIRKGLESVAKAITSNQRKR